MHIRRGALYWGVFLILAGAVPLAVRAGYLTDDQVSRLWSLWPLVLVGIGVGLILSRTNFNFMGGLVIAATFGLIVGGLLSTGVNGFPTAACGSGTGEVAFPTRTGSLGGSAATVDLQLDCGNLTVAVASGTGWTVEGKDADGTGPKLTSSDSSLRVVSNDHKSVFGPFAAREDWKVTLPDAPSQNLTLHLNAGSATANLGSAGVGEVDLVLNAGSTTLDLGTVRAIQGLDANLNAGSLSVTFPNLSFEGSIEANAGSVKMCVPDGAGLRLRTDGSNLASFDYSAHNLVQNGATWVTPGFDSAAVKIDLQTQANAGSFSLDPEEGCD